MKKLFLIFTISTFYFHTSCQTQIESRLKLYIGDVYYPLDQETLVKEFGIIYKLTDSTIHLIPREEANVLRAYSKDSLSILEEYTAFGDLLGQMTYSLDNLNKIKVSPHHGFKRSVLFGTLIGLAVGAFSGHIIEKNNDCVENPDGTTWCFRNGTGPLIMGLAGASVGSGFGTLLGISMNRVIRTKKYKNRMALKQTLIPYTILWE